MVAAGWAAAGPPLAATAPLLSQSRKKHRIIESWAVVSLAVFAVVGVALVWPSTRQQKVALVESDKSTFPLKKVVETKSVSGKPCWACPCCNGCEKSGAAKAAGCGALEKNAVRKAGPAVEGDSEADPAFSPVQKQLVRDMIDSELHEHGLDVYQKGSQLVWRNYTKVGIDEMEGSPAALQEHHMFKQIGDAKEEDVISPLGEKDWFERPTRYADKSNAADYEPWKDPSGIWSESPVEQDPWHFAESGHWDRQAPGHPEEEYEDVKGKMLQEGDMTHGDHKKWAELSNPQWGWEHQFANWDPDGGDNKQLVFGSATSDDEIPPWELSWVDPKLNGDDFIPEAETRAKYTKPVDNQFADWQQEGAKNQDLVFGHNHDTLRQRSALPVKDNWNVVMDSAVAPDEVTRQLGLRGTDPTLTYPDHPPAGRFFSDDGADDAPLADARVKAKAPPADAAADAAEGAEADGGEYTPDQKRGFGWTPES